MAVGTTKRALQGTRVGLARTEIETEEETVRETDTGTEAGTGKSIGAGKVNQQHVLKEFLLRSGAVNK